MLVPMDTDQTCADMSEQRPVQSLHQRQWLTVPEAVRYCADQGLSRTPKTLRKWAARSHLSPENADISVRQEDTENGFRWSIEVNSLDRKIDEELEYERRKQPDVDRTGAHQAEPVSASSGASFQTEPSPDTSEPVHTGEEKNANDRIEAELRAQLEQALAEVDFLRGELTHRRQTDKALGTVIEAFKLNAEATRAQQFARKPREPELDGEGQRHDIVPGRQDFDQP